ncbi:bacteriohemerythrin [Variovorax sp. SRS16]|uniref:bacteriohemerythrin n=1 Tax=Variovorax sp. SRS16 TaxID=282217 RepID=UPI0013A52BF6|nr:hemerythrin family protein [Variovorax sp. SRS16]
MSHILSHPHPAPIFSDAQSAGIPRLGDTRLDGQHDEIHALVRSLRTADPRSMLEAFDVLHAHVLDHFAMEEALMALNEFSSKECHISEHAAVRQSFQEVRAAIEAGRPGVAFRFAQQLLDWLPEHADALDRHLVKLLFFQKTGGAAVLLHRLSS